MAPLDFQKQFEKYKNVLIEEFIQEFGEEYRDIIIERINSHKIILQSNPLDDYTYMCNHTDKIKFTDRFIIKERYRKLEKIKEKARNYLLEEFQWMIYAFFEIDSNIIFGEHSKELVTLFGNSNFDESYIDSYSSASLDLLNRWDTPQIIKENILNDQRILKEKLEEYGVAIDNSFISEVDNFLEKRKVEKEGYYRRILESNFSYNKELTQYLSAKAPDAFYYISFFQNPNRAITPLSNGQVIKSVFYPVVRMMNKNIKSLDTTLIHELIHTIERDGSSTIINEIVVQKTAITIAERLHENGIFIFDDPKDYQMMDNSAYEKLFPIIDPILSEYFPILKDACINSNYDSLDKVFGGSWNRFLLEIEKLFTTYMEMIGKAKDFTWCTNLSNINKCMEEINDFYHRGGKHV